ncbi:MAG: hypothetical protein RR135_05960 [Oscillospiraceae bacterium]
MAATGIRPTKLGWNSGTGMPAAVAIDATDGALVDFSAADSRILLFLEAASAATATIKRGNGLQGIGELVVGVPANGRVCVVLESMKFVDRQGAQRGKLHVTGAGIKVACVELP